MAGTPWIGVAADALLVVHGFFIVWAALGAIAVLRWPRLAWLHLPAVTWVVWIEWSGGICPLTPLEVQWRIAAGQAGYQGGFIEHYVTNAIYPQGLTREVQFVLGALVLLLNAGIYARVVVLRRRALAARPLHGPAA